jgi:hypothetical protein
MGKSEPDDWTSVNLTGDGQTLDKKDFHDVTFFLSSSSIRELLIDSSS